MKKHWKAVCVLLLAALIGAVFAGCGQTKLKDIEGIRIVSGSFKENYSLDEAVDLSSAYIVATYVDNTTERIKIQTDWITGLDVSTTGSKTLVIKYRDKQTSFIYSVAYKMSITTPVRLTSERADAGDDKVLVLSLRETERMPVYAVKLEISLSNLTYAKREDNLPEGWEVAERREGAALTLLYYNRTGSSPLTAARALTKLYLQGSGGGVVYIQGVITDGTADRKTPDLTVTV